MQIEGYTCHVCIGSKYRLEAEEYIDMRITAKER
jgi:hypothetical protein